jgi:signal transduction histidine kinase
VIARELAEYRRHRVARAAAKPTTGQYGFVERNGPAQAVRDRVSTAVADLDDMIKVIRSTIFASSEHDSPARISILRAQVLQLCQDATGPLGFAPAVRFTGPVDYEFSEQATEHVLAVAREALSNIARHAHASSAHVDLTTADGCLLPRIADNGIGIREGGRVM